MEDLTRVDGKESDLPESGGRQRKDVGGLVTRSDTSKQEKEELAGIFSY